MENSNSGESSIHKKVRTLIEFQDFFKTKAGETVLYDLQKRFGYFVTSYCGNGQTDEMTFKEGQKNVLNYIHYQMKLEPAKILENFMANEKKEMQYDNFND